MSDNSTDNDILNDKSDPRGVWVPRCLIVNTNITHAERMILALILQMHRRTGLVYFTNPDFADELALGEGTVKKRIPDLARRGYITITDERYKGKHGKLYPRRVLTPLPLTCEGGTEKELGGSSILTSQKFQKGTEMVPKRNEGSSKKVQPTNSTSNKTKKID